MTNPASTIDQNLLPVQAYFDVFGNFQTFIGQGKPFYAAIDPYQSGLHITNSTIDSSVIGGTTPAAGYFTAGQVAAAPVNPTDIVNKQYADYLAAGLSWKQPVNAASTANITLLSGPQTIDGVSLVAGDRVLVKNQTLPAQNGIYTVNAGPWTYASGSDTWAEYVGAIVFVVSGSQQDSAWYSLAQPGGTLGVTALNWSNFSVSSTYTAGTGLTLSGTQFSITNTAVTAGAYGSASNVATFTVNAQGQLTAASNTAIAIAASQVTSGTFASSLLSGSYTGITGVGVLTAGTWNAATIGVAYGGTGAATLTGYVKGNGTSAFTASATVPTTDLSGTITNAQLANSTISGVALGGNLFNLTAGSNISFSSGTTYNGSAALTINASVPAQVYPGAGIANSTGSAWGTSYSTTGSGTVVALATSPVFVTPTLGVASGSSIQVTSGFYSTGASSFTFTDGLVADYITGTGRFSVGTADGFAWYNGGVATTSLMTLSSAGALAAASFAGAGTGLTGTASSLSIGGNAATATTATTATSATTATTATNATNVGVTDNTSSASAWYPTLVSTTTGNLPITTSSTKLSFVPSTGVLSATTFSGAGTSLTGTASSLTAGTASTANALNTSNNYQVNSLGVGTAGSGTAGEIRATNNVTAFYSSDARLKENIKDIDKALDIVCAIGSKTFNWTDDYIASKGGEDNYFVQKSDFGVIAQDVQSVFPQAVRIREDGTLAVDYEKLATLSFGAIQALVKRIEDLESK